MNPGNSGCTEVEVGMGNVVEPKESIVAEWYDIVREAESTSGLSVSEELENYLVNLLFRYMDKPEIADAVLSLEFLRAEQQLFFTPYNELRKVGDQCLLYSGLFPERALRRRLKVSYFVELGQLSYQSASKKAINEGDLASLFKHLSERFVRLMDILQSIRSLPGADHQLSLLLAVDLWHDTHSEIARRIIAKHTDGFLVKPR